MLSKNQAKIIQSLRHKKFRQKYNLFVAEGVKTLQTILLSDRYKINTLYHTEMDTSFIDPRLEITQVSIDQRMMKTISFLNTPSPALALVETLSLDNEDYVKGIYLDGVQDPGNVGTIIRIADWFGFDAVIRSPDSADFYSPKVVQSSMGAFANIKLLEMEHSKLLESESQLVAAHMDGIDCKEYVVDESFTLIMGSEGKGLSSIFKAHTKVQNVSINGDSRRLSDSLNVSIAAGIICAELSK